MATPTFYSPSLTVNCEIVELSEQESMHAIKSRRLSIADKVNVLNGLGIIAEGEIVTIDKRLVTIRLSKKVEHVLPVNSLHIVVALPKGDRQKVMIDMLTQIGVSKITPLLCSRSITKYKSTLLEKWQRIVIESCKQSQNPWMPQCLPEVSLENFINSQSQATSTYFADSRGESIDKVKKDKNTITLLIGPEGGFTDFELGLFKQARIKPISLTPYILRTETAAIVAAGLFLS